MKTRQELEAIENLVKRTYNRRNNRLRENLTKPYDPDNPELGYSWKFSDPETNTTVYNVVVADLGPEQEEAAYFIKMHEYAHIYLTHFEGSYEELDRNIATVLKNYRGQLIEQINKNCNIDFAESLLERVIDDPILNHSLHNIAMDMECNSVVLDADCVEAMEKGVTAIMPKIAEQRLMELRDSATDETLKKKIDKELEKMSKETKVKFILPERYEFPPGRDYAYYMIEIIKNLDKFIKSSISIAKGGSGDIGDVSDEDLEQYLSGGMGSLDDLMRELGMLDDGDSDSEGQGSGQQQGNGQGGQDGQGQGQGNGLNQHDDSNSGGFKENAKKKYSEHRGVRDPNFMELQGGTHKDHRTTERDKADKQRELGNITAGGGTGCGNSGGAFGVRNVAKLDPVDEAIDEVIMKTKSRVVKRKVIRDVMRNYNLGKIRTVIAPSIIARNRIDTKPKIVYLIDISGSMDTVLIDRILSTISKKMKSINRGLRYDIITWSTRLGEHIKDIDPRKSIPEIHTGGGTRLRDGIKYFKENYDESCILIIASDFEDYLQEWASILKTMSGYSVYGFNYGRSNYEQEWPKNFTVKNFNRSYKGYY